jgi:hypothetical protein
LPKPLFPEALQLEQTIYLLGRTPFYPMTEKRVLQAKAVFTVSAPQHRLYHPELPGCLF